MWELASPCGRALEGAAGHVDEVLRLRTGDVNVAALRLPGGDLGQDMSYVVGCNRLIGGELMASTTASTPSSAASKPWPVIRSTPCERLMGMASCPFLSRAETVRAPILPVAPATAIRMVGLP